MAVWTVNTTTASGSVDTATRTGALVQILAAINDGDTIMFDSSLEDTQTGLITILLSSPLRLPALAFTIDGGETWVESGVSKTRVVLDGQSGTGIATTTAGTAAAINGVTFINGAATNGAALNIVEASSVSIRASVFKNNEATAGGAIYNNGTALFANVSMTSNKAVDGGAVYNVGTFTVATTDDATFESGFYKNEATAGRGGAIYSKGTVNVSGTTDTDILFKDNVAKGLNNNGVYRFGDGGAIFAYSNATTSVADATFVGNEASRYGGAISTFGKSLTLTDTTFGGEVYDDEAYDDANAASVVVGNTAGYGGALHIAGATTIEGFFTARNNLATTEGHTDEATGEHIAITSSDDNGRGGAIWLGNGQKLTLGGSASFTGNDASFTGGAIHAVNGELTVSGAATFTSNKAGTDEEGAGGAIYNSGTLLVSSEDNVLFEKNSSYMGGAIYTQNTATVVDAAFDKNTAARGGALYLYGEDGSPHAYEFVGNSLVFTNNEATAGGAIYSAGTSRITLNNCTFYACSAATNGGGLYSTGTSQNTLTNCVFIPPENNSKTTIYNNGTNTSGSLIINGVLTCDIVQFNTNSTTVINGKLTADVLTINNGSSVTFSGVDSILAVTTAAQVGSATFTAAENSSGFLVAPKLSNLSKATIGPNITVYDVNKFENRYKHRFLNWDNTNWTLSNWYW